MEKTMSTLTPEHKKEVLKKWRGIIGIDIEMKKCISGNNDKWYNLQEVIRKEILELMRMDFSHISKNDIFKLCGLIQSHRPMQLHTFLIYMERMHASKPTNN